MLMLYPVYFAKIDDNGVGGISDGGYHCVGLDHLAIAQLNLL